MGISIKNTIRQSEETVQLIFESRLNGELPSSAKWQCVEVIDLRHAYLAECKKIFREYLKIMTQDPSLMGRQRSL